MKKKIFLLIVILLIILGVVSARNSSPEVSEDTLRHLTTGDVIGFEDQANTYAWKGIPFAKPPIGDLRWRAPRPTEPWEGVRETLNYGSMCSQVLSFDWLPFNPVLGSEDCLYLDVWTPRLTQAELASSNLPVMVYIHGGANTLGMSAAIRHYHLAGSENVIVVALQYRLGLLGWFSHPALRSQAESDLDASSNFALLDMMAALQWVQDNINEFGGDPSNVTIFGQSAGGFNVYALLGSPIAKGLFHKAIVQSGNIQTMPRQLVENYEDDDQPGLPYSSREYINKLLISDGSATDRNTAKVIQEQMSDSELTHYLRGKTPTEMFDAVSLRNLLSYKTYSNVRDGIVLPNKPLLEVFADPASYNSVPLIVGSNRDEYKLFLWGLERFSQDYFGMFTDMLGVFYPALKDLDDYNRISAYFSDQWQAVGVNEPAAVLSQSRPGSVYAYRFDWDGQKTKRSVDTSELFGAAHGIDTVFLSGPDAVSAMLNYAQAENESDYEALGDLMRGYWAEFARNGKPGNGGNNQLPEWQPWQSEGVKKLMLDIPGPGLRMTGETFSVKELKQRLLQDKAIDSIRDRCELYAQLFWYALTKDFFNEQEYRVMGCEKYPLDHFEAII